jgi:hypothetical protein
MIVQLAMCCQIQAPAFADDDASGARQQTAAPASL